ncbi:MAG: hypothetical protein JOY54_19885 [Acidobacteriaceae bacterium]|nr:hypothetical protein [Acidobacteriaceae bacterium]
MAATSGALPVTPCIPFSSQEIAGLSAWAFEPHVAVGWSGSTLHLLGTTPPTLDKYSNH